VERIKLRGRMLLRFNERRWPCCPSPPNTREKARIFHRNDNRRMYRNVRGREHVRRFGSHVLAAAVTMIRWRARHGAAALHALMIQRQGGHAIGEPQEQQRACGQKQ
jgi:hypothetical protein